MSTPSENKNWNKIYWLLAFWLVVMIGLLLMFTKYFS